MLLAYVAHMSCGVIVGVFNTTLKVQEGKGQLIILIVPNVTPSFDVQS